uniref:BPTI/Kunitz inhibitor domain-containing protein n=1 Tax=Lates calcarifer TaxID=8187 RepID=A0A4W6CZE6_LATCA
MFWISLPIDRGTCHGVEKRFAYNPETRRCQMFHYSGCGGNRNNFPDRKKCFKKCIGRKAFVIINTNNNNTRVSMGLRSET